MSVIPKKNGSTTVTDEHGRISGNLPGATSPHQGPPLSVVSPENPETLAAAAGPSRVTDHIEAYWATNRGDDPEVDFSVLADFVADTLHYARSKGIDVDQVLRLAQNHYYEETAEADEFHCQRCGYLTTEARDETGRTGMCEPCAIDSGVLVS